jgi:hypothetical protein
MNSCTFRPAPAGKDHTNSSKGKDMKDFDAYKIRTAVKEFSKVATEKNGYAYVAGYYESVITDLLTKVTKKARSEEIAFIERETARIKTTTGLI